jgi:iron complex transport system ATP-binding protein
MIEIKGLSLAYGKTTVLSDINLSIRPQGLTSIIGPNGAGKSSLLSVLNRLQKPTNGTVYVDNAPIHSIDTTLLAQRLSILRQDNRIEARITVEELISFGRYPYHKGRPTEADQTFVDQAIAYLDLQDFRKRFIDQLSGGQRQRAFIAMVLAQDTQYVFLDEPLNNLDMKHSVAIMKQLRKACNELNKSIVVVLHDINFASCYSDEIVTMKNGTICQIGTPEEIMQNQVLHELYDMPLMVEEIHKKRLCLYYL